MKDKRNVVCEEKYGKIRDGSVGGYRDEGNIGKGACPVVLFCDVNAYNRMNIHTRAHVCAGRPSLHPHSIQKFAGLRPSIVKRRGSRQQPGSSSDVALGSGLVSTPRAL